MEKYHFLLGDGGEFFHLTTHVESWGHGPGLEVEGCGTKDQQKEAQTKSQLVTVSIHLLLLPM